MKHGKRTSTELTSTTYTRHVSAARHPCSIADVANHGTSILITVIRCDTTLSSYCYILIDPKWNHSTSLYMSLMSISCWDLKFFPSPFFVSFYRISVAAAPQCHRVARCLLSVVEEEDLGAPEPAAGGWPHSAAHPFSGGTGVPWRQHRGFKKGTYFLG